MARTSTSTCALSLAYLISITAQNSLAAEPLNATQSKKACDQGIANECGKIAKLEFDSKNFSEAKIHSKQACDGANMQGCNVLGLLVFNEGNKSEAKRLYELACKGGYGNACYNLGNLLNTSGDKNGAARLFKNACDLGSMLGCNNFGFFENERGNKAEAERLYKKACEGGSTDACNNLGALRATRGNIKQTNSTQDRKITEKEAQELNRFKRRDALINPLIRTPGNSNRFDKDTIYIMKNFKIVQKLSNGYLITANLDSNQMTVNVALLVTAKQLPADLLISGVVYYSGEYKYTGLNGFQQSAPVLKIPAGLPITGIHNDGVSDPFKEDSY